MLKEIRSASQAKATINEFDKKFQELQTRWKLRQFGLPKLNSISNLYTLKNTLDSTIQSSELKIQKLNSAECNKERRLV